MGDSTESSGNQPSVPGWEKWARWAAIVLLIFSAAWWGASFLRKVPQLYEPPGISLSTPVYHYFGMDFIHNYAGVRTWREAGSPYPRLKGDPINPHYIAPPPTLFLFSWALGFAPDYVVTDPDHTSILPDQVPYPAKAIMLWFVLSVAMIMAGVWVAARVRAGLPLERIPLLVLMAAVLLGYPVIFELERGNFNVWVLLLIAIGCWGWIESKPGWWWDVVAGVCMGLAAGLKVFPLILLPGLIVLRRFIAAGAMVATVAALWLGTWRLMGHWTFLAKYIAKMQENSTSTTTHSLSIIWRWMWHSMPWQGMSPGVGALLEIAPLAGVVGLVVMLSQERRRVAYPFLLWLAALGTWAMMISVDYNLLFLMVATAALWQRRDPWWLQIILVPWWLVWQPFLLVPEASRNAAWFSDLFFAMKAWSTMGVGVLLIWRVRSLNPATVVNGADTSKTR